MEFRVFFVFTVVIIAVGYVQCYPGPRDSTVVKPAVVRADDLAIAAVTKNNLLPSDQVHKNKVQTPVSCQYEEPTEAQVCMELCLPKGYSYGLCVGRKCSCI